MNEKNVLYVGFFELPDKNAAAHRVLNNAKILKQLGYNTIFCGVNKEISSPVISSEQIPDFESFPIPYPSNTKQWIRQMLDINQYSYLINRFSDIKLVICYNLHAVPLAKLIRLCHRKGIKIIADCTEWYENKLSINPIKFIKCLDTTLCMRVLQKKCDGMIAISNYLGEYYKKSIKNILVVPPLVDLEDEKFAVKKAKIKNDVTTFVYSGSPSTKKEALGDVVKCFNNISDCDYRFKIVGISKEQFINMYGIRPNEKIEFMGRISHKEAVNIVRESDYAVIVRPKTRVTMAGFPTKFAEAISLGTAVVANDVSDLSSYLKNGKNGYLIDFNNQEKAFREIILSKKNVMVEKEIFNYRNQIERFAQFLDNIF